MDQEPVEHIWALMARKLSGEASPEEREELSDWLHRHPEGHYAMEIMQDIWKNKSVSPSPQAKNQLNALLLRINTPEEIHSEANNSIALPDSTIGTKRPRKMLRIALFISIVGVITLFLSTYRKGYTQQTLPQQEISTQMGAKSELTLPDGTRVWLNAGSKITYDKNFGENNRTVTLSGEAFFDVVKNASMPFYIHTRNMQIKVIGTAFNVKCYPGDDQTETSLVRGKIEVMLKGRSESIMLRPHEKLLIAETNSRPETASGPMLSISRLTPWETNHALYPETSWVENKLIFRNESLLEIAQKMERWYGLTVRIKDPETGSKKFTGIFTSETADEALAALQLVSPFSFTHQQDTIIIGPYVNATAQ